MHFSDINIFISTDTSVVDLGQLEGHKGVTMAKWSNKTEHRLVSSGFDSTIRVWNTESMQCISLYLYSGNMFTATFLPSNEDFILACGQGETIHMFDSKTHMHEPKASRVFVAFCFFLSQLTRNYIFPFLLFS